LAKRGEVLVFNNSGFSVTGVGLRFYVPDFEEGDAIVEAVYVELSVLDATENQAHRSSGTA
jgi:hypothetical protein